VREARCDGDAARRGRAAALVAYLDSLVAAGAGSRAAIVARALSSYQRQALAEADAAVLDATGDYDDFDDLVRHTSIAD
jgi:hypothetical protein